MGKLDFHTLAKIHNIPFEEAELIHLQPGNRVGPHNRYEIVDLLGLGSVGVVYLVKDFEMNKALFALKMILPYMLLDDEEQLNMFIDYLSIIQDMDHPNIVRIKDFWKQNTLYFYTMEYIEGTSLTHRLRARHAQSQYLSLTEVCDVALQICQGLAFLHQHSGHYLLHSDNILLISTASSCQVKVSDFGIYYLQPNRFWKELAVFTERQIYQPPELRKQDTKPMVQADLFSLAALLYEMLVNIFPGYPLQKVSAIRQDVPPQLENLLMRCLEEDPHQRPHNIQEVISVLHNVHDGLATRVVKVIFTPTSPQALPASQEITGKTPAKPAAEAEVPAAAAAKVEVPAATAAKIEAPATTAAKIEAPATAKVETSVAAVSEQDIPVVETKLKDLLDEGDNLIEQRRYSEAVRAWKKGLGGVPHKDKEIHDRIMQVVDMKAEQAKSFLENGKPYEAAEVLQQVKQYSADPMIKELDQEIAQEIQECERRFEEAMREGNKHFEKKQLAAAIEVWQGALGLTNKDEMVLRRVQSAKVQQEKLFKDEEEYLKLMSLVRNLEQHENFQSALQTLEKMRQRKGGWACPIANLASEVERMTKLMAAANSSREANKILNDASDALKKGKLDKANNLLNYPVFKRALTPAVVEKYQNLLQQLAKQSARHKLLLRVVWVGGSVIAAGVIAGYLLWFR
jgi:serine/threonine-protein kinase